MGGIGQFRPSDFERVDGEADLICRPDEPPLEPFDEPPLEPFDALGAIPMSDVGAVPVSDGPASEPIVWKRPQVPPNHSSLPTEGG